MPRISEVTGYVSFPARNVVGAHAGGCRCPSRGRSPSSGRSAVGRTGRGQGTGVRAPRPRRDHTPSRTPEGLRSGAAGSQGGWTPRGWRRRRQRRPLRQEPGRGRAPRAAAGRPLRLADRSLAGGSGSPRHPARPRRRQVHTRPPGPPRHPFSPAVSSGVPKLLREPEHKDSGKRPTLARLKPAPQPGRPALLPALARRRPEVISAAPETRRAATSERPGRPNATGRFRED